MTRAEELGIYLNYNEPYIEYDSNGNIIYEEKIYICSITHIWNKMSYDSENRVIYTENNFGMIWNFKYDEWENQFYAKNNKNFGFVKIYDKNKNVLYTMTTDQYDLIEKRNSFLENLLNK